MLLPARKQRVPNPIHPAINSPTGGKEMGLAYAEIELTSHDDLVLHRRGLVPEDQIKRMKVNALVDSPYIARKHLK